MKQLHRQSSMSKQHRPHHHASLSRTLASYLLREQRLLFVLLGFLLASSFFLLGPSLTPHPSSASTSNALAAIATRIPSGGGSTVSAAGARRLPVGVRKPSLRVVVTGGAGFVGSHLIDKLLARGDSVIVVDNFFTGRKDNVAHHLGNPRFELIRHDVVEPILIEVDQIYHLACPASPVHYKFNPIKTIMSFPLTISTALFVTFLENGFFLFLFLSLFSYGYGFLNVRSAMHVAHEKFGISCLHLHGPEGPEFTFVCLVFILFSRMDSLIDGYKTNVMGTLNMLGLAKRVGARFLLTSTSEVYGDPLEHPQKESYWGHVNPIGVRSCYDEGKRTAETLTMDYHRGAGVEVRIARIFNTYGPRMCLDDGRVVSNFVAQALRKQPMTVYGDGKQTRSFQYVSDLVDGLVTLMESEHIGPFNLGNPGEFTMLELAQVVKETIDPGASVEFKPNTADDPHMRKPDISKAKSLLNWEPKISLKQGLPRMVSDLQKRIMEEK